jgi:ferritin-like metal-binding protein YciE
MSWFKALKPESLRDLFVHEIKCVYDMEKRQVTSLTKMADAATDPDLIAMFEQHLSETRGQVRRLEAICARLDTTIEADTNASARGVAADADVAMAMGGDDAVRDAALIMAAQSAEHLEIARYGTMRTWATILGMEDVAWLIEQTLEEERAFDHRLTDLATAAVNVEAAH